MRDIARFLGIMLAGLALVLVIYFTFIYFFFFSDCGGNEEAANAMRKLPEKRLESLFVYAKGLYGDGSYQPMVIFGDEQSPTPNELADLKPRGMQFFGGTLGINVSGCMDDKVYLFVEGLDPDYGDPKIVLSPGERKGTETLWQPQ